MSSLEITRMLDFFEGYKSIIDDAIGDFLSNNIEAAALGVSKYITEGGKRLRGLLVLYVSYMLGGSIEKSLRPAVAIELVHASSLALDDIIDNDMVRRGRPAAWIAKGVSRTVLVSNLLIPMAVLEVEFLGQEAVKHVLNSWLKVTRGEILDVFSDNGDYETIVHLKTASLFQLSLYLGALSAGKNNLIPYLERYGLYLGTSYQVADDLADAKEFLNSTEKPKPVSRFLEWLSLDPREKHRWEKVFDKGIERLRVLVREAEKSVNIMGENKLVSSLMALPRYMVNKMLEEGGIDYKL